MRDLHLRTSAILRVVEEGATVLIEKRGTPIAELRPVARISREEMLHDMEELWETMRHAKSDSTKAVSRIRNR